MSFLSTNSNHHSNAHNDSNNMHEVKGFPSASNNYQYIRDVRGQSSWLRNYRLENALASVNGYDAPTTEVDGDVYIVESPALDCNAITWQSGTTVRFTFTSGYTNIYATGNYLQVSDAANSKHNGVFLISAINASYLEVTIADVTDATDDVASASTGNAYVTHEDYDPENLSNGQTIPRQGMVKYYGTPDLWYGDAFEVGDEILNISSGSVNFYDGTTVNSTPALLYKEVTLTEADITGMYATPVDLIDAPGANKVIVPTSVIGFLDYGGATYTGGGNVLISHGTQIHYPFITTNNVIVATSDKQVVFGSNITNSDAILNEPLSITNLTAAFATGDGTFKLKIVYYIADFS